MTASERLGHPYLGLMGPAEGAFAITADSANELEFVTRALYVGTGGDLHVLMQNGDEVTLVNLPGGFNYPYRVRKVFADSTATDLVGLY